MKNWNNLNDIHQIDELITESHNKPIAIFKHSTTCGISHSVKQNIENDFHLIENQVDFYYLDLLTYRPISNEIAAILQLTYPQ